MNVDYRVVTEYVAVDSASPKLVTIGKEASKTNAQSLDLIGGLGKFADGLAGAFDAVASHVMSVAKVLGVAGVAATVLGGKIGLDVNKSLEDTGIAFATIFNMLGASNSFDNGLFLAKDLMEKIRQDAAALPGEFQDFADMAKTLSAPLINAGRGMEDIRNLTRDTVVATAALLGTGKGAMEMGGREMAQLIAGRAGAHNVLGTRLGINTETKIDGKAFNKATSSERIDFITHALAKAKDSLPAFQRSWSGLTSTMMDDMKRFLGSATGPAFEKFKDQFVRINSFLESDRAKQFAAALGVHLGAALDFVMSKFNWLLSKWEDIESAGVRAWEAIRRGAEKAWPYLEKIGIFLGHQLEDPGKFLTELVGLRVGLGAMSMAPAMVTMTNGLVGGGGAAGAMGAALGPALAILVPLAIALGGAFDVLNRETNDTTGMMGMLGLWGRTLWEDIKQNFKGAIDDTIETLKNLWVVVQPIVDLLGVGLLAAIDATVYWFRTLIEPLRMFSILIKTMIDKVPGLKTALGIMDDGENDVIGDKIMGKVRTHQVTRDQNFKSLMNGPKGEVPPVNITNNISLTVLQENDPERVAKHVATALDKRLKYPNRAIGIPNYLTG